LISFEIPGTVVDIGHYCFSNSGIKNIAITAQHISIGYNAFAHSLIESLSITSPLFTKVPIEMCYNCSLLSTLSLPNSVKSIETDAFALCVSLKTITLPKEICEINARAFYGCSSLTSVEFPNDSNIEAISEQVFGNCNKLTNLIIDPDDTKLTFYHGTLMNKNRTNIMLFLSSSSNRVFVVPESVERIAAFSFSNCNLKSVVIPDGKMTYIGINAFKGCKRLSFLNLPDCITTIANGAFEGCKSLKCGSVNAPEGIRQQAMDAGIPGVAFSTFCIKETCRIIRSNQKIPISFTLILIVSVTQ
jgi:hypothetical protein